MKILQISDIHWTPRRKWEEDFMGMKNKFLEDIERYRNVHGEIDYVFICGDIAFKGVKKEYEKALEYIDSICQKAGCTRKDVYVVPGNHDLNRKATGYKMREMINASLAFGANNNAILDDVVLKSVELRTVVFGAFKDYYDFARFFFCDEEVMNKCINEEDKEDILENDKLFYHGQLDKKVGDFAVSIRGVNTALNCDSWDWNELSPNGHLQMLPKRSFFLDKLDTQEIRIIMGHHPLGFLTSQDMVEEYLNNNYHIQLFGHVHMQYVEGDNFVRVLSGALNPPKDEKDPEKYRPVYNIIDITQIDRNHIKVKGISQIWYKNKFVYYEKGSFEKEIEVEQNNNKWEDTNMRQNCKLDTRGIKFMFMRLDNRSSYFDKIKGLKFIPKRGKTEYDSCLDFLAEVEKKGKMIDLYNIMK